MEKELEEEQEFKSIISDLAENEVVNEMRKFRQHCDCSCYDHCMHVAYYTYLFCKKHNLDYVSATRAAMLHDLFLYDWRVKSDLCPRLHGYRHPRIALNNAMKYFELNDMQKDIILKHMWPLTLPFPKYKESYAVTLADKYSTYIETADYCKRSFKIQKFRRYAYVFLSLLIFRLV